MFNEVILIRLRSGLVAGLVLAMGLAAACGGSTAPDGRRCWRGAGWTRHRGALLASRTPPTPDAAGDAPKHVPAIP